MQHLSLFLALLFFGCSEWEETLKNIDNSISDQSDYQEPAGAEASKFFAPSLATLKSDVSGIISAINVGVKEKAAANLLAQGLINLAESEETQEVSSNAAGIIEKVRSSKQQHIPDAFIEDDSGKYTRTVSTSLANKDYSNDTVTWDSSVGGDYTIPVLDKMPSRDQGQRGTCAAFAGVGQIEGYILQNSALEGLDLSEQRFYAMSKPEHWTTGGDINSGGSNSGDGFGKSYYQSVANGDQTAPSQYNIEDTYNIPLESKCPYSDSKKDNDIQHPSTKSDAGCQTGVVQVKDFNAWFYKWDERIDTAQDVYNFLRDKKYPVIVFTRLSDNWEYNDGMVTWAEAEGTGSTSHASGHAYLAVGMKQLSEVEFPGEGGMCFYIKNSWGKGWGVNGLSCMTLTWFNKHRFSSSFPSVTNVAIDTAALNTQINELDQTNENVEQPDPNSKTIDEDKKSRPRGKVGFARSKTVKLAASDYTQGKLLNNEDSFSKVLYRIDGEDFYLRGLLAGGTKQTHDAKLTIDASSNLSADLEGNGHTIVGAIDQTTHIVKLCSHEYSEKCHFNYLEESNEIFLAVSKAELLRDDSTGPYDWTYLGVAGSGFEISFPEGFSSKIDLRFAKNGKTTNPLRFRIKPLDGYIQYQGVDIGDYQKGELCSGTYKAICRIVRTDEKFLVMFKSRKGA